MAVMNNMREYTKTILIILVLAFVGTIIFDWGMNVTGLKTREGIVGEVEGEEITLRQFDRALTLELKAYRDRTGNEPSESQLSFIRDQVWESLVRDILVRKAMRKKGIRAEDQEIIYRLFNAPPEILKNNPSFLNDKKQFDMAKYQAALNDPRTAAQWRPVEDYLRQTIPYEKFQQRLEASVRVTDDEIRREYLKQYQKAAVKYIFIDPNRFKDQPVEISEAELKAYYDQHKDDFHEEEKRKIQYVLFPITTTAEDSAAQYELANRILSRAKKGEDFAELAEIYSEDPGSRDKGGDLGYFARGAMVKEFEDAAFGAKVGEIVGPVKTRFGLHLIKVFDKKKEDGKLKVKASHILLKFQPSEKTRNRARDNADLFAEQAQDGSFEDLAKEYNLTVQTSSLFVKGNGFVPGLGLNKKASRFIFSNPVGSIGEVEETAQGYFVYRVTEVQEAHTKTLEEVSETIKSKLAAKKRMQMAGALAQKLYDKIQNGTPFEDAATRDSLEVKETASFTRTGFVPGVGRDPRFIGTAFALEKTGEVSKPVEGTRGYYILKLLNKTPFDKKDFLAKKEELKKQLIQRRQSQVFASWYADVKAKARIKDLRDRYY